MAAGFCGSVISAIIPLACGGGANIGGFISQFSIHRCSCNIKETFGVKSVPFHRVIPIELEPWAVRESPIIVHEVVKYIRWFPAEDIKTVIQE